MQTCPNCRKVLRLHERNAAASKDEALKEALDSLLDWNPPEPRKYEYGEDPQLDLIDDSNPGIWKFNQPWPENVHQVVVEHAEVSLNPYDIDGSVKPRFRLLDGYHRRVTIFRTGEVEEIAVTGHWWDSRELKPHECHMGVLPRAVVRELNLIPSTPVFAARINSLQKISHKSQDILELFIDIAIDETPVKNKKPRRIR